MIWFIQQGLFELNLNHDMKLKLSKRAQKILENEHCLGWSLSSVYCKLISHRYVLEF